MRFEQKKNGFHAVVYFLPFAGLIHNFNDHGHAYNFVRYLFSKSRAHPENDLTALNLITRFDRDGAITSRAYNLDPFGQMQSFLRDEFPDENAHKSVGDDGAYFKHPMLGYLPQVGVSAWQMETDAMGVLTDGPVGAFDEKLDGRDRMLVEASVHAILRRALGREGDVVMMATHRDQPDHNPNYHVHRLLRK